MSLSQTVSSDALKSIPANVQTVATRALSGSLEDLKQLLRLVDPAYAPDASQYDVSLLPVFYTRLSFRKIPSRGQAKGSRGQAKGFANPVVVAAFTSFQAITTIIRRDLNARDTYTVLAAFRNHWDSLWAWVEFFHRKDPVMRAAAISPFPDATLDLTVHSTIIDFMVNLQNHVAFAGFLRVSGVSTMLINVWLTEAKLPHRYVHAMLSPTAMEWIFCGDPDWPRGWAYDVKLQIPDRPEELASLVLHRLDAYVRNRIPPDDRRWLVDLKALLALTKAKADAMAFANNTAAPVVTRVFRNAIDGDLDGPPDSDVIHLCLTYLTNCFQLTAEMKWIRQSLAGGLVPALKRCATMPLSPVAEQSCIDMLTATLPPYLAFRSTVSVVFKASVTATKTGYTPNRLPKDQIPPRLYQAIMDFDSLLEDRHRMKVLIDTNDIDHCSYIKCYRTGEADTFRKCPECDLVYCSRECQKLDWQEGRHRKLCNQVRALRLSDPHGVHLSRRDNNYWSHLSTFDWVNHLKGPIEDLVEKQAGGIPDTVWIFDYTCGLKPRVLTKRYDDPDFAASLHGDSPVGRDEWMRNIQKMRASMENSVPYFVRALYGGTMIHEQFAMSKRHGRDPNDGLQTL